MFLGLRARWRNVLHGFWFVPGLVVVAFSVLAFAFLRIDRGAGTSGLDFFFSGSGSAARTVLSTIAASLITVAGLALSITIVAVQLVAGQYSPRATRELLADRFNQVSAGAFVGIFVYCLIVLRAVRDETEDFIGFVPSLSVSVAILLGVAGLAMLLGFIHHMAQSIKLPAIASRIGRGTLGTLDSLYPERHGEPRDGAEAEVERWREEPGTPVHPSRAGYVQQVRLDDLVEALDRRGTRLELLVHPGTFVTPGRPVAVVRPPLAPGEERAAERVCAAIPVTDERDSVQDPLFGLQQLKDIALRAVSPSVNDPSTALTCIGYLAACLERLAGRPLPSRLRAFPQRDVLAYAPAPTFDDHLAEAFEQLVAHVADVRVAREALLALALVARAARPAHPEYLPPLLEMADRLSESALSTSRADAEREAIVAAADEVHAAARAQAGTPT